MERLYLHRFFYILVNTKIWKVASSLPVIKWISNVIKYIHSQPIENYAKRLLTRAHRVEKFTVETTVFKNAETGKLTEEYLVKIFFKDGRKGSFKLGPGESLYTEQTAFGHTYVGRYQKLHYCRKWPNSLLSKCSKQECLDNKQTLTAGEKTNNVVPQKVTKFTNFCTVPKSDDIKEVVKTFKQLEEGKQIICTTSQEAEVELIKAARSLQKRIVIVIDQQKFAIDEAILNDTNEAMKRIFPTIYDPGWKRRFNLMLNGLLDNINLPKFTKATIVSNGIERDICIAVLRDVKYGLSNEDMFYINRWIEENFKLDNILGKTEEEIARYAYDFFEENKLSFSKAFYKQLKENQCSFAPELTSWGTFRNGQSICYGLADAYKRICDKLGITCEIIYIGIPDTYFHASNLVKIGGQYYTVDVVYKRFLKEAPVLGDWKYLCTKIINLKSMSKKNFYKWNKK